jgi:hypothetical protein
MFLTSHNQTLADYFKSNMGKDIPSAVKDRKELEVKLKEKGYSMMLLNSNL